MGNTSTRYGIAANVRMKIELLMSGDVPELDLAFGAAHSASASATKSTPAPTIEIK